MFPIKLQQFDHESCLYEEIKNKKLQKIIVAFLFSGPSAFHFRHAGCQ